MRYWYIEDIHGNIWDRSEISDIQDSENIPDILYISRTTSHSVSQCTKYIRILRTNAQIEMALISQIAPQMSLKSNSSTHIQQAKRKEYKFENSHYKNQTKNKAVNYQNLVINRPHTALFYKVNADWWMREES